MGRSAGLRAVCEAGQGLVRGHDELDAGVRDEAVAEIRWKSGGKNRARVRDGLIVAVFRN